MKENDILLTRGAVKVRALSEGDAGYLLKWMTDPAVLEFYEGRDAVFTPRLILEHFYDDEDCRRCIIEYESLPIGYMQIYELNEELYSEYHYPHPELFGFAVDQFIGEPEYWGRGIGRTFISMVIEYLTGEEGAQCILLDPHADNLRALRCYEACGFKKLLLLPKHELHEGVMKDCWLMEYRAP